MEYLTHSLIEKSESIEIVQKIKAEKYAWQDGKKTAGSHAAKIKHNCQLDKKSKISMKKSINNVNVVIGIVAYKFSLGTYLRN